ncbi:unnamed protein product [Allacma fusca]|uniref:Uncharacterized protein n=1 Tax=Allacma fusca TaxID=39272 RepID=A0A8J2JAD3_9HEXA|nr:unnamed protein product [Allacma fusca]
MSVLKTLLERETGPTEYMRACTVTSIISPPISIHTSESPGVVVSNVYEDSSNGPNNELSDISFQKVILRRMERMERKIDAIQNNSKRFTKSAGGDSVSAKLPRVPCQITGGSKFVECLCWGNRSTGNFGSVLSKTGGKSEDEATKRVLADIRQFPIINYIRKES